MKYPKRFLYSPFRSRRHAYKKVTLNKLLANLRSIQELMIEGKPISKKAAMKRQVLIGPPKE
jgi:hypothetical protein